MLFVNTTIGFSEKLLLVTNVFCMPLRRAYSLDALHRKDYQLSVLG